MLRHETGVPAARAIVACVNTATPALSLSAAWRLTRPGFLALTAAAVALGLAMAAACGCGFDALRAGVTLGLALAAHAAANAWNDYHDALNGADAANPAPLSPFTGGSRVIQQGTAQPEHARQLALGLTALVVLGGLWLALQTGTALLAAGLAGLVLGWAYSAPPLRLMARGLGEVAVAAAWWLIVQGAQVAQRGQWSLIAAVSALPFALLVANILLINALPDAPWDARVGKRTLAVRLGPVGSAALYTALAAGAHAGLAAAVWLHIPPATAWWGLASAPLSLGAAALLWWHLSQRRPVAALRPAIGLTIGAAIVHALALAGAFAAIAAQR